MEIIHVSNRSTTFSESQGEQLQTRWSAPKTLFEEIQNFYTIRSKNPKKDVFKDKKKVLRRLQGIFVQKEGEEARVIFVENESKFDYFLPMRHLEKSGITIENQPFEMDEVETQQEDGSFFVGYVFRPSSNPEDAYSDTVDLDPDRKLKRARILKRFKNAKA